MKQRAVITGLHHAGVVVPDLDRGIAFYSTALGLELLHQGAWEPPSPVVDRIIGYAGSAGRVALLRAPFGYLELFEYLLPEQPPQEYAEAYRLGIRHLCFETEDPDLALKAVVDSGGSSMFTPQQVSGGGRAVYCRDPFGNLLEFSTSAGRFPSIRS